MYEWVVEIDIKGFFDNIDHDLLMKMVEKHTKDKSTLLYCKKFIKAEGVRRKGEAGNRNPTRWCY